MEKKKKSLKNEETKNEESVNGEIKEEKTAQEETGGGDYREEMEELARIFKEELQKAVQDSQEAAEIDDLDKIEVEGYDPKAVSLDESRQPAQESELCECCGERPRGTKKNPDSVFCEQCEAILEKYPYDWKGIVAVVAMLGIVITALVYFASQVPLFSKMKLGDSALAENKVYTAMTKYDEAVNCIDEEDLSDYYGLFAKRIKAEYKLIDMSTALSECEEYIPESVMKLPSFRGISKIYDEIRIMQGSAFVIQDALAEYETVEFDEIVSALDALSGKKIYEKNGSYYPETDTEYTPDGSEFVFVCDEGWLNLYRYSAAIYSEQDEELLIDYLEKAADGSEYLQRLVYPLLASTYVGTGNYDKAESLALTIKEHNAEGVDYYMIKSMLARYRDSDYEAGIKYCDEGLDMLSSLANGEDIMQQLGYILSIQKSLNLVMQAEQLSGSARTDKLKEALDFAGDAYSYSGTVQARDFYAIVSLAVDNTEVYDALSEEIEEYGDDSIAFSDHVTDYKDGKISLTEIAMSGRYDLQ